jgi:hypothetical protein
MLVTVCGARTIGRILCKGKMIMNCSVVEVRGCRESKASLFLRRLAVFRPGRRKKPSAFIHPHSSVYPVINIRPVAYLQYGGACKISTDSSGHSNVALVSNKSPSTIASIIGRLQVPTAKRPTSPTILSILPYQTRSDPGHAIVTLPSYPRVLNLDDVDA